MDQWGTPWKWNLAIFKRKNEFPKQLKAEEKNGFICLVFMSTSWVMALKLSKIVSFSQFFADVSKKSKTVREIYVYTSESSCFALLENGIGYYAIT